MKNKKLLTIVFFALIVSTISFTACKTEGCTDADSVNFDADANKDDGSCKYEGAVVFWFNQTTSENLIEGGVQNLSVYVNDELAGNYATTAFFETRPDCSSDSAVIATKDLGSDKIKSYVYKVIDDDDWTWWEGTIEYEANACIPFELQWAKKK